MQWKSARRGKLSGQINFATLLLLLLAGLTGCTRESAPPAQSKTQRPFEGVNLTMSCSDAATERELVQRAAAWAKRTGAQVERQTPGNGATADVAVIRPVELGRYIANKAAQPVPESLREASHPLAWSRILTLSIDRIASWGSEARAIPLAGEAYVLAYRTDRFTNPIAIQDFSNKHGRRLAPPTTWEEYADIAEHFTVRGQPCLAPVANDTDHLLREFNHVAACFNRPAVSVADFNALIKDNTTREPAVARSLSLYHDLTTGEPRLTKQGFVEAAKWLARLARCRRPTPANGSFDAGAALVSNQIAMAVLSMPELGQLAKNGAVPDTIGIAPLPGTRVWYDSTTGQQQPPSDKVRGVNFVPYFGVGGWVGVVRESCANSEAAFDLLADLSRLDRSVELLSDPMLGFGPFRVEHLDQAHETLWQRYGFDAQQTHALAEAIRYDLGISLANPAIAPRGADQAELMTLLAAELNRVVSGTATPVEAMAAADAAWRKADQARPAETRKTERRLNAGLQ